MKLCEMLGVPRGIIAAVGGGGKTALLERLYNELDGTILRTTTTHIWPPSEGVLFSPTREQVELALQRERRVTIGKLETTGKLTACGLSPAMLVQMADYVLIEADGSRGLPVKAPADDEPVVPPETAMTIAVAGMTAVGKAICDAAHRPERYAQLTGESADVLITPQMMARVLVHPFGQRKNARGLSRVVLNQADTPELREKARVVAACLSEEVCITALKNDPDTLEHWRNGRCLS